jgi:hypothetical protein
VARREERLFDCAFGVEVGEGRQGNFTTGGVAALAEEGHTRLEVVARGSGSQPVVCGADLVASSSSVPAGPDLVGLHPHTRCAPHLTKLNADFCAAATGMDDLRKRKLAHNEALFREANETIARLRSSGTKELRFICECPAETCTATVELSRPEYEQIRAEDRLFLVLPGHQVADIERVVADRGRYLVCEKIVQPTA